jgi:hypothetical protein
MNRLSFEKELVEVQDLRRITDHFRGIYGILPQIDTEIPEDVKPDDCAQKSLRSLGSAAVLSSSMKHAVLRMRHPLLLPKP